jgi:NAD(P)H dehydrogenase (quinone)
MILITGATGNLGTAVIEQLLKNDAQEKFIALVRSADKAAAFIEQGIEVRTGDFDDPVSLDKAMQGIDKVLLISTTDPNRLQQHQNVVDAARKAGVKHILYTGITMKDVNTSALQPIMESHFQTEAYIQESGLTYTFLRNAQYMEVIQLFAGEQVFETGIHLSAGNGKATFALRREMGEAAANVLLQDGHENKTYHITGSELLSYADIAQTLSELSGKQVVYTAVEAAALENQLKQFGVPEFAIFLTVGFATDTKNNQFETVTDDLEKLLGRQPAALKAGLKELYKL